MDGPGTITWEEFVENAESFVRVSDEILDSWKLRGDKNEPAQAYLVRQVKTFVPFDYFSINREAQSIDELNGEFINNSEDPFEAQNALEMPLITEHHVLWSMSYSVPVLYFNAWISDFPGINAVTVEQAQQLVPQGTLKYTELSQTIHPILGSIFLQLHPCMSKELIQNTSMSNNKLVSWLSTVAPAALNLKVRNEYFELTRTNESVISKEEDEELMRWESRVPGQPPSMRSQMMRLLIL